MEKAEIIRLLSTVIVIFIVLMLHFFYQRRYGRSAEGAKVNIMGVVIVIVSILLALLWMWGG